MITVRKAYAEDYEEVLPLLLKFNADSSKWENLFKNHWHNKEDYFGFVLVNGEKIIGFLGTIFSTRFINGQEKKFCNLSSWVVDNQYKKHGLSLFLPVLELEDYTITNFSSAEKTYIISKKLGFEDLESDFRVLYPSFNLLSLSRKAEVVFDHQLIIRTLSAKDLKIFEDHKKFKCVHILIKSGGDYCYLIIRKSKAYLRSIYYLNRLVSLVFRSDYVANNVFLGHLHYISNKELFCTSYKSIVNKVCAKKRLLGLLVDQRQLGRELTLRNQYKVFATPIFRSTHVSRKDVDSLYSESFLLDL